MLLIIIYVKVKKQNVCYNKGEFLIYWIFFIIEIKMVNYFWLLREYIKYIINKVVVEFEDFFCLVEYV